MARAIRLQRSQMTGVGHAHIRGFRLRIDAVAGSADMPLAIFVYYRNPTTLDGTPQDVFMTVASFPDISEYPEDAPAENAVRPFFRKTFVELDVRSTAELETIWASITSEAEALARALDRADQLVVVETLDLGDGSVVESSESEEP